MLINKSIVYKYIIIKERCIKILIKPNYLI